MTLDTSPALVYYPYNIYVTMVSADVNEFAYFAIDYRFINRDPSDKDLIEYQEKPPIKEFVIQ